jgi:hypothetical protein
MSVNFLFDIHSCSTVLIDELDTTFEVRPEVSPDLPHICREKRKHEINTQNLPMKNTVLNCGANAVF